ncbi:hypothetical protein ACTXT7_008641 [Hymenolepis weldensis]
MKVHVKSRTLESNGEKRAGAEKDVENKVDGSKLETKVLTTFLREMLYFTCPDVN